jgi:hypothetical protein
MPLSGAGKSKRNCLCRLQKWATNLGVSLEVLLHRILVAAIIGQLYVEKIPEI